ncbi:MAG: hypothetical protein KDD02_02970, partial [Phaeodactylibacter sp.]|nr:hypothetical protein [Phaeodactylibacter sp.]
MKRRKFLKATGAVVSLPILLNGFRLSAMPRRSIFNAISDESDRVLVLIQMNGGNDGLNAILPLDQYDRLANVRSNILIPENEILGITDTVGLHPALAGVRSLFDDARLNILQSVGYPNQNRSH